MRAVEAEVKCYERKQSKKGSSGKKKEYKNRQSLINLRKDHPFEPGEIVLVTDKGEYYSMVENHEEKVKTIEQDHQKEVEDLKQGYQREIESLKQNHHEELSKLKEDHAQEVENLEGKIDKLENEKNFMDKRLDKAYKDVSEAQDEVTRLRNRGLFDYLKSAIFHSGKAIEEGKK
jgi:capsule polysaccharide export protein KpsE/RkpR